ncbi:type II toxin-antitoxin system Phd/YefM family antitoxin [Streptomyces sp. WAC 06738]|uniref:type II toxin-antitoxin system Phd/YefM family antitoxin n=1 Tax=unclassified Streptomyces TaxID=2593676 RepID=UPI000F6BCCEA|nr:type II toxin-antitoxin system Phd/YefM family antitoxin [Streptomyces sp. WAC 06738]AZM48012.1 type II toxin-antitoxin system prevent-host-death family antitoxin [Streptomyces sp. WAC 06738]
MSETLPIAQARSQFGALVRRAALGRERTIITDHGEPAAMIVGIADIEDLEDALAVAQYEARKARGEDTYVPHDEVRRRLGLDA